MHTQVNWSPQILCVRAGMRADIEKVFHQTSKDVHTMLFGDLLNFKLQELSKALLNMKVGPLLAIILLYWLVLLESCWT